MLADVVRHLDLAKRAVGLAVRDTGEFIIPTAVLLQSSGETHEALRPGLATMQNIGQIYITQAAIVLAPKLQREVCAARRLHRMGVIQALREMRSYGLLIEGEVLGTYLIGCFTPEWTNVQAGLNALQDEVGQIVKGCGLKFKVTHSLMCILGKEVLH